jgi:hypothetical protein
VNIPISYYTANFRFKFVFTSKGGNNIYIDDINIEVATGMEEISDQLNNLNVFPNPAADILNLSFELSGPKQLKFQVSNMLGQTVYDSGMKLYAQGSNKTFIELKELENGFYFVKISDGKQEITKKVVLSTFR